MHSAPADIATVAARRAAEALRVARKAEARANTKAIADFSEPRARAFLDACVVEARRRGFAIIPDYLKAGREFILYVTPSDRNGADRRSEALSEIEIYFVEDNGAMGISVAVRVEVERPWRDNDTWYDDHDRDSIERMVVDLLSYDDPDAGESLVIVADPAAANDLWCRLESEVGAEGAIDTLVETVNEIFEIVDAEWDEFRAEEEEAERRIDPAIAAARILAAEKAEAKAVEDRAREAARCAELAAAIRVPAPTLRTDRRVIAHLGPTNSGKTHAALQALMDAPSGAYGAPLRLLAMEVQERLSVHLGKDRVGIRTGEERIRPDAPYVACTTELLVPRDTVVLDEAHWLSDSERGGAWTRALLTLECRELHLVGSPDVLPLLELAVPGIEVRTYARLAPLTYAGTINMEKIEPGTAVVAFSRRAVLALARDIGRRRSVGVLYGAMPPAERRRVASRFTSGEIEVLCTTDVLGHGVNMPIRTIVFAETSKWNGSARVPLEPWEAAQIAGRAGRFGFHDDGLVGILVGHAWAYPDAAVVLRGLEPREDLPHGLRGFRRIEQAVLAPEINDLGGLPTHRWIEALSFWWDTARRTLPADRPWLTVAAVSPLQGRLRAVGPGVLHALSPEDAWAMALAPIDHEHNAALIARLARAVVGTAEPLNDLVRVQRYDSANEAETAAEVAAALRWFTRRWPGIGGISAHDADTLEEAAAVSVGENLPDEIRDNAYGKCVLCGRPTLPSFTQCNHCHQSSFSFD